MAAALRLQALGHTVCLLEAGGVAGDDATAALGDVECVDLAIGPESGNRWFGGSTNTWWGKVALLDPIDLSLVIGSHCRAGRSARTSCPATGRRRAT